MGSPPERVLVYAFAGALGDLAGRLRQLGYEPVVEQDARTAAAQVARRGAPIHAALIPAGFALPQRRGELDALLRAAGPRRIGFAAVGERPGPEAEQRLRENGVRLRLWAPFDDRELRFVLNRALADPSQASLCGEKGSVRHELRAPTSLAARISVGGREKPAFVYSLSASGCYLETLRPTPVGANVEVTLPLPAGELRVAGRVVLTNVAGNLERANLPRGMAIEFLALAAETREALRHYVQERARAYDL